MKNFIGAVLAFSIFTGAQIMAQTQWVICENPINGMRQQFPNSCPSGWIYIGI